MADVRLSELATAQSPAQDTDNVLISRAGVSYKITRKELIKNFLAALADVSIVAPADGDVLTYDATNHVFTPQKPQTGGITAVYWDTILDKPTAYPPSTHQHAYSSLTGIPATFTPSTHTHAWVDLSGAPATYAPSAHTHPWADLTNVPQTFPPSTHQHAWADLSSGVPATFPPSVHNHDDRYFTESELSVSLGGGQVHWNNITGKPSFGGGGDMLASVYDANGNGVVDAAETVAWEGVTAKPLAFPPDVHGHDDRYYTKSELSAVGGGGAVDWSNLTSIPMMGSGDMLAATYDPDGDSVVDQASSVPWLGITDAPLVFPPAVHTHVWADLTDKPATFAPSAHRHPWGELDSVPATFVPSAHQHAGTEITSAVATANAVPWTGISDKPAAYTPSTHNHVMADITNALGSGFGLEVAIGSGSAVVPTGIAGYLVVPFNCTITSCTLLSDVAGSITVDIWRQSGSVPATASSSIVASDKPSLASETFLIKTALTGWSTTLAIGDVLAFNVDSASTLKQVTLALTGTRL